MEEEEEKNDFLKMMGEFSLFVFLTCFTILYSLYYLYSSISVLFLFLF